MILAPGSPTRNRRGIRYGIAQSRSLVNQETNRAMVDPFSELLRYATKYLWHRRFRVSGDELSLGQRRTESIGTRGKLEPRHSAATFSAPCRSFLRALILLTCLLTSSNQPWGGTYPYEFAAGDDGNPKGPRAARWPRPRDVTGVTCPGTRATRGPFGSHHRLPRTRRIRSPHG